MEFYLEILKYGNRKTLNTKVAFTRNDFGGTYGVLPDNGSIDLR